MGHLLAAHQVGIAARAYADVAHVLGSRGLRDRQAEGLTDVVAVRPGLHDPRRRHRGRAHGRTEPRDLLAVRDAAQRGVERDPALTPRREQLLGRQHRHLLGAVVDIALGIGGGPLQAAAELVLVGDRCQGGRVGPVQVADLVPHRPALGRRDSRPAIGRQSGHPRVELQALVHEVRQQSFQNRHAYSSSSSRTTAHESSTAARRLASSLREAARPRPRSRSRVAWTSRRLSPRVSSIASSSTAYACVSRPTRRSRGATSARRVASVRAATHSSSAAKKTGETNCWLRISSTARVRPVSGSSAAAARMSSRRRSVRCPTAATTRSCLLGKWCSCAPRLTPARLLTTVVVVPAQPSSTRQSTVASISRSRIARVRSPCGVRIVVPESFVTHPSMRTFSQTVKPDCL
ncbi:hypothetical protein AERO9AM_70375 [Aeromicrobium sp. 9AM]|nr:hypothetical protein AERO9AM_70375 [Aeromicrobium sp. 9AM]